jgi:hypothetical protein
MPNIYKKSSGLREVFFPTLALLPKNRDFFLLQKICHFEFLRKKFVEKHNKPNLFNLKEV